MKKKIYSPPSKASATDSQVSVSNSAAFFQNVKGRIRKISIGLCAGFYSLMTDRINGILPGVIKIILFFLSLIYGACVKVILFCYKKSILKTEKLNCRVISIGNITLGGTGKTPLVEFLATYLKKRGYKVGILSRGYKRDARSGAKENLSYKHLGDESSMLTLNNPDIPIGVDKDRIKKGSQIVEEYKLDTVLLDDGFQYYKYRW